MLVYVAGKKNQSIFIATAVKKTEIMCPEVKCAWSECECRLFGLTQTHTKSSSFYRLLFHVS